jgi:hypothetical protein
LPLGGLGWYHWATNSTGNIQILDNNANVGSQDAGSTVTLGVRYNFKMKVFSSGVGQAPTYRIKIWPASQSEPASWSVSYTGAATDPSTGALGLIAQECDVNIGNVSIVPTVNATRPMVGGSELVALYRFTEGVGNKVKDVAGNGTPLDLTIKNTEATSWRVDGLSINMPTTISSDGASSKVEDAVKKSNEMTIEAWLQPTMTTYSAPSRFIGFEGNNEKYFEASHALSPDRSSINVEATMGSNTADGVSTTTTNRELTHVVLTQSATATTKLFVNGVETASHQTSSAFASWKNASLVLGGEQDAWLGVYKLVAIYSSALSANEVKQNFEAGPEAEVAKPVLSSAPTSAGNMTITTQVPKEFALYQNFPNPFNPSTTIKFDLPKDENVSLTLYNLLGQQVATLVNERRTAGRYNVQWNAQGVASGVYIYRIAAGDFIQTRKLMLLK